jgi:hypothetical protein
VPRKRQLEVGKRIWVGTECENRWDDPGRAQAEYAKRNKIAAGRGVVGSASSKLDILYDELAKAPRFGPLHNQLISDIRTVKDQMRPRRSKGLRDLVRALISRPGSDDRKRVLAEVAAAASAKFGESITPRMADKCWKEYQRKILARIGSE